MVKDRGHAIMLAAIILSSVFLAYYVYDKVYGPISVDELASREFKPGDVVVLEGTVSSSRTLNTTYGEINLVKLEGMDLPEDAYEIIADREYKAGEHFSKTLHFKEFRFNGVRLVTAPELFSTYLVLPSAIQVVTSSTSFLDGFALIPESCDSPTNTYRVFTNSGDEYPITEFNMTLLRIRLNTDRSFDQRTFPALFVDEYLLLGSIGPEDTRVENSTLVDHSDSLDTVSDNGTVSFTDTNSDGLLNNGDEFVVNIPPTYDEGEIDSYILFVSANNGSEEGYGGIAYMLNWYSGQYSLFDDHAFVSLKYEGDDRSGEQPEYRVSIYDSSMPVRVPLEDCRIVLDVEQDGEDVYDGYFELSSREWSLERYNITVEYLDRNGDGSLDVGDEIIVSGPEEYDYSLRVYGGKIYTADLKWNGST